MPDAKADSTSILFTTAENYSLEDDTKIEVAEGKLQLIESAETVEDVFSTYLYTGNGTTQTIENGIDLAGEGGMVWTKGRNYGWGNILHDTTRGVSSGYLGTHLTNPELGSTYGLTVFNGDGYSINSDIGVNTLNDTYASWTFREAPGFFDIVTYTGDGTGTSRTLDHNLGITP